jgi:hypothetical protein
VRRNATERQKLSNQTGILSTPSYDLGSNFFGFQAIRKNIARRNLGRATRQVNN